jgi:hypothetical protein
MVEKFHLFAWQNYPLFSLAHDIVSAPETLKQKVEAYLMQLREEQICDI